jgi:alpha-ketoglutarate-dependent taurine dioxygenase
MAHVVEFTWASARGADIEPLLTETGSVLLHGVDGPAELRRLAAILGRAITPGAGIPRALKRSDDIYEVKVQDPSGAGLRDRHGNTILSTTASDFPPHTDGYNLVEPPRFVLLLRVDPEDEAPVSSVSDAVAAIASLPAEERALLRRPLYGSAVGELPVLDTVSGQQRVRFNAVEMRRWSGAAARAEQAIATIAPALRKVERRIRLRRGDCLLMDNWRMCHGREALPRESKRVLLRMWIADRRTGADIR